MEGKIGYAELKQAISVIGEAYFTIEERDTFCEQAKKFAEWQWMLENGYDQKTIRDPEQVEEGYKKLQKWIEEGGELMVNYSDFTDQMFETCLSSGEDPASLSVQRSIADSRR
jgi:flagellar motility protein MotE (MotC chaperone)